MRGDTTLYAVLADVLGAQRSLRKTISDPEEMDDVDALIAATESAVWVLGVTL